MTPDLWALREWLQAYGVTHVALESTGVYWKPVYALVAGTTDPVVLADLARGKLRKKLPALQRALHGRFRGHHALWITESLSKIDYLDDAIARLTAALDERLVPFEPTLARLDTIPGIDRIGAISLVAETGGDMARFRPPAICAVGVRCVRDITKVREIDAAARRATGTSICAPR